ncbi:MAG: hypothetical protein KF912_00285 [Phycisphaeraceae bacterium]|nr:hypothetical protein [Phycisphaeraceae bacterium]MBX3365735.1 hypothetical protein [Phycisphaeraceae bacterium]QYK48228.1 MAG: hypothetical protein KF838_15735 [Phycisphaeraceae bacterium]
MRPSLATGRAFGRALGRPCCLALGLCAAFAASSVAGPLVLSGTGRTIDVWPHLPGGDQYPFVGLEWEVEAQLAFEFHYDSDTPPTTLTDTFARYVFPGGGSTFAIDGRVVEASLLEIVVWHDAGNHISVDFMMHSTVHQMYASIGLIGIGLPPLVVPSSLDSFSFPVELGANSYLNDYLLPILMGRADTIVITPAPGSFVAIGFGVLAVNRRRR